MRLRSRFLDLVVLAIFGTCGGMLAEWIRTPQDAEAATKKPKVVTAQEFRLTDLKGKKRGSFVMGSTGQPRLDLYGTDGKLRTSVFLSEEGEHPVVALSDVYPNATPQLQTRIVLGTQDGGSPRIYVTDTNLAVRADLGVVDLRPAAATNGAFLKFYDPLGVDQASLYARGDGVSEFTLNDTDPLSLVPSSRVRLFSAVGGKSGVEVHGSTSPIQPDPTSALLAAGPGAGPRLDLFDPSAIGNSPFVHFAIGYPAGLDDGSYTTSGSDPDGDTIYGFGSEPDLFLFQTIQSYEYAYGLRVRSLGNGAAAFRAH